MKPKAFVVKEIVLISLILIQFSRVCFSQDNLILNGDFETGNTGWSLWGGQWSVSDDSHSGSSALLISGRTQSWHAPAQQVTGAITKGEDFTFSYWVKLLNEGKNLRATLQIIADGATSYKSLSVTANPTVGNYVQFSETVNIIWTGELEQMTLYFESDDDGSGNFPDYLLDDVVLKGLAIPPDSITGIGLKDIESSMLIGWCATEGSKNIFTSAKAKSLTLNNCNSANIQCYPAWGRWDETQKHVYHLDAFNKQVKQLKDEKIFVSAHMLLGWDMYFPDWYLNGDFEADTVEAIMNSWIKSVISYNGNDTLVDNWNVVNEAISWDGKGGYWPVSGVLKNSCELERMGYEPDSSGLPASMKVNSQHPVYIRKAFHEARKYTTRDLELRDASFEFPTDQKYKAFYQLVVHMLNTGTPLDAVGFQTHLDLEKGYDWVGYAKNIKRYKDLGLKVNISEVDVGDPSKSWSEEKAKLQKAVYYQLVTAAIRGGADQFETWGFIDDNNEGWRAGEKGLLFTNNLTPKPSFSGIREALTDMSHILFWEMEENIDSLMPDVTIFANDGTLNNMPAPQFTEGFKNKGLLFDGVDDFLSVDSLSAPILNDFAFTCFIKTAYGNSTIADFGSESGSFIKLLLDNEGNLMASSTELKHALQSSIPVNDDKWHFVALKKQADTLRLYLDSCIPVDNEIITQAKITGLHAGANLGGTENFSGIIDELKFYNWAVEDSSFVRNMIPLAPINLSLSKFYNHIRISWADLSTNEDGFIVQKKTVDGEWETVDTVAVNSITAKDYWFQVSTTYTYRVKAFNRFGESACALTKTTISPLVGIKENQHSGIAKSSVYPNPASESFTIRSEVEGYYSVFSLHGVVLEKGKLHTGENHFSTSKLPDGVFVMQISKANGLENTIFAIKR